MRDDNSDLYAAGGDRRAATTPYVRFAAPVGSLRQMGVLTTFPGIGIGWGELRSPNNLDCQPLPRHPTSVEGRSRRFGRHHVCELRSRAGKFTDYASASTRSSFSPSAVAMASMLLSSGLAGRELTHPRFETGQDGVVFDGRLATCAGR